MGKKAVLASYFRNFIFGVEDSLVSTVGLLSGIVVANVPHQTIFLSGIILIFVEAFSMGAGSFLSESSAEDYEHMENARRRRPKIAGVIMFFSYFLAGFIPLFPYLIFTTKTALWVSIVASLVTLFILGIIGGKISRVKALKTGIRMLTIGGAAILLGVVVGKIVGY